MRLFTIDENKKRTMNIFSKIDPFVLRGGLVMIGTAAVYLELGTENSVTTAFLAVAFLAGVLIAVASPTRWSGEAGVRLYRTLPLLVGTSALLVGGYYFVRFGAPIFPLIIVTWGLLFLASLPLVPWDEVESRIEEQGTNDDAVVPLPRSTFSRGRYAGTGLLLVTASIVIARLLISPELGAYLILAGITLGGLFQTVSAAYAGPPRRVVRVRQARLAVPTVCVAAGSIYIYLAAAPLVATLWLLVAVVLAIRGLRTDWEKVERTVAEKQREAATE